MYLLRRTLLHETTTTSLLPARGEEGGAEVWEPLMQDPMLRLAKTIDPVLGSGAGHTLFWPERFRPHAVTP